MSAKSPALETTTATSADTEYSMTLRKGTNQFSIFTNHASAVLRIAYVSGAVATPTEPYINVPSGREYFVTDISLTEDITIYIASDTASTVVNLHYWS